MTKGVLLKDIFSEQQSNTELLQNIFERICFLCARSYRNEQKEKLGEFRQFFLNFDFLKLSEISQDFIENSKHLDPDSQKKYNLEFFGMLVIFRVYQFEFSGLGLGLKKNRPEITILKSLPPATFIDVLNQLYKLEDLSTLYCASQSFQQSKLISHAKQLQKCAQGGKTKAENRKKWEAPLKYKILELYKKGHPTTGSKWKSKTACIAYFLSIENYDKSIDDLLTEKTMKRLLNEAINDRVKGVYD